MTPIRKGSDLRSLEEKEREEIIDAHNLADLCEEIDGYYESDYIANRDFSINDFRRQFLMDTPLNVLRAAAKEL